MSFEVVGIGEVLWDLLPSGPEMGGAPANFAYHAQALGARGHVVTRVGNDQHGQEIMRRIEAMGLSPHDVQVDESAPTGTVAVVLAGNGNPEYTIHENTAWDRIAVTPEALAAIRGAHAICFGSLAQRSPVSRASIHRLVAAAPAKAWRVFDINLRQRFYSRQVIQRSLDLANVLKLNEDELRILANMLRLPGKHREQITSLAEAHDLKAVVLTRGEGGSLIYKEGLWSDHMAMPVKVVDTVGAGDAFAAALVLGLLCDEDLDSLHAFAGEVAGYVCSRAGATPALPEQIRGHHLNANLRDLRAQPAVGRGQKMSH